MKTAVLERSYADIVAAARALVRDFPGLTAEEGEQLRQACAFNDQISKCAVGRPNVEKLLADAEPIPALLDEPF